MAPRTPRHNRTLRRKNRTPRLRTTRVRSTFSAQRIESLRSFLKRPPNKVGLLGDRWSPARITQLLNIRFGVHYSARYAVRVLRKCGLKLTFKRAREPRLSATAAQRLRELLQHPPSATGFTGDAWSRARVAQLIEAQFGVHYSPLYAGRLVHRLKIPVTVVRRERRLQRAQGEELRKILAESPRSIGWPQEQWSRPLIAALIAERYGIRYHVHSIRRVLQRWKIDVCRAAPGRLRCRLNAEQISELRRALALTPQEAGIAGSIWTQRRIALFIERQFSVRYRYNVINRMLARLGIRPACPAARGGANVLNIHQEQELIQALQHSPLIYGGKAGRWTRAEIARFIQERFHVSYTAGSVPRLLRRLKPRARTELNVPTPVSDSSPDAAGQNLQFPRRPYAEWQDLNAPELTHAPPSSPAHPRST